MKFRFNISGLDCPNCAAKLASMIETAEGVSSAKINYLTEKLTLETELSEDAALAVARSAAKSFSRAVKVEK